MPKKLQPKNSLDYRKNPLFFSNFFVKNKAHRTGAMLPHQELHGSALTLSHSAEGSPALAVFKHH
jgi:hypothetical protein